MCVQVVKIAARASAPIYRITGKIAANADIAVLQIIQYVAMGNALNRRVCLAPKFHAVRTQTCG